MISFKECLEGKFQGRLDFPSVTLRSSTGHEIFLKFTSKDVLTEMTYEGRKDPWLGALCALVAGKTLNQLEELSEKDWDQFFQADQVYWDHKADTVDAVYFLPSELLKASLDKFRGRDYLYREPDALICRCFGVREQDVLDYVRSAEEPTPEGLAIVTKAGMGCRSCVPQITKWLSHHGPKSASRFYKERSRADWILEIDALLKTHTLAADWEMEVESFQGTQVVISFTKEASQKEIEAVTLKLQDFLGVLDSDLSFFLRRSRHLSNA